MFSSVPLGLNATSREVVGLLSSPVPAHGEFNRALLQFTSIHCLSIFYYKRSVISAWVLYRVVMSRCEDSRPTSFHLSPTMLNMKCSKNCSHSSVVALVKTLLKWSTHNWRVSLAIQTIIMPVFTFSVAWLTAQRYHLPSREDPQKSVK